MLLWSAATDELGVIGPGTFGTDVAVAKDVGASVAGVVIAPALVAILDMKTREKRYELNGSQ